MAGGFNRSRKGYGTEKIIYALYTEQERKSNMNKEIEKSISAPETAEALHGSLSVKRANLFYLIHTVLSLGLSAIKIPGLPVTWVPLIYYIPLLGVAYLLCRKEGKAMGPAFGFHRVKPLTVVLTIVTCTAMRPVAHLISSLTNVLFPSFFEAAGGTMLGGSFLVNFVGVAMVPVFFEEFVVRGGMLNSYIGTGRLRAGILLTALLFGLQHMNVTQLFYAFVVGIVMGLLFVLTDSIWPGILFHFLNNALAPVSEVLEARFGTEFVQNYLFPFARGISDPKCALVTVSAAVIGLVITVLCLRGIARCEGSWEKLRLSVRGGGGTAKLVTPALIIALVLMLVMTGATTYALVARLMSA